MDNRNKIFFSYLIVVSTIVFAVFYYNRFEEKIFICGTPDIIDYEYQKLNNIQKEGRKLFKTLCASCHKLDKKLIGPALARDDWEFDYFLNYTINEEKLINAKDPKALNSNNEYLPFKHNHSFNQLSKVQVNLIFEYVNKVDFK